MQPPKSNARRFGGAVGGALRAWFNPDTQRDAAAISYFSLFALFPAILVMIALADAFISPELHRSMSNLVIRLFPGSRAYLRQNIAEIISPTPTVVLSCLFVVVWASMWVFTFIENSFNRIWGTCKKRTFWESRLRSIGLLLTGSFLLMVSAVFTITVSAARSQATGISSAYARDQILDWLQSSILLGTGFLLVILVFAVTYKLMPDKEISWFEVWPGAVMAAFIWEIAVYIFAKLVPHFDYQRVYGQTGAIVTLLIWVYTSTLIMLFGASFSAHFSLKKPGEEAEATDERKALEKSQDRIRKFPIVR